MALGKELAEVGHDAGAQTIAWHLREQSGTAPSVATIWRVIQDSYSYSEEDAPVARPGLAQAPSST